MSRRTTRAIALVTVVIAVLGVAVAALASPARADQSPTVSAGDILVDETDTGTTAAVFTLTLTQPSPNKITVAYSTSNNTARAPGDYTSASGQIVFPAGVTTKTVTVDVVGDTRYEGDEVFYLYVSSPDAFISTNDATATIVDDDPLPYVTVGNTTVTEGNSGTANAVFPVTLDRPSVNPVRVRYEAGDGNAIGSYDYTRVRGTLTIPAGQTAGSVTVAVTGDTLDEGRTEYFYLYIGDPVGARLLSNDAVGTINDDDGTVQLSLTDSALVEGNSGTTDMVFKVTLSAASPNTVIASYNTSDGSAQATQDYLPRTGTLNFAPGETSKTISVPVVGDTADEGSSQFFNLGLYNVSGAETVDPSTYGEIVDDDPTRSAVSFLTVDAASVTEPDTGTVNITFAVLLQPASTTAVTVNYATSDAAAAGGSDYVVKAGTLTIPAGQTRATVAMKVNGDQLIENTEYFGLNLSGAVNATIDDGFAYGYILDDDLLPTVSVSDATVVEGDTGDADASFAITLSEATNVVASVVWSTGNNSAVAGSDYSTVSATAVFQPGETTQVVHVPVTGDTTDENDEVFFVYLGTVSNAAVANNTATVVIVDDDRNPTVRVDDTSVYEGTDGPVNAEFTVRLSAASANTVTVNYGTGNGNASAPADFTAVNGTATFAPGQTSVTVLVPVVSDTVDENNEYLYLYVGTPVNATIPDNDAVLTILDDDTAPSLSVNEVSAREPNSGTTNMVFTVTLSGATANVVTVNYATADGNAIAPGDYTGVNGTLTFAPGETTKDVPVPVVGDTIRENNEFIVFNLGSPANATFRDSSTYGTIIDTDPASYVSITDIGVNEGNTGSKNAVYTVTLSPASVNTVTVSYGTTDGSALAASDYVTTAGTLTFAPGQRTKTISVPITGDTVDENDEYFNMYLSSPTNAGILDGLGYATIFDDDPTGGYSLMSIDDVAVTEKNSGTTNTVVTVTISPAPTSQVTVVYRTSDSGATAGSDYLPQSDTLTFAAGETSKTFTVTVLGDTVDEADEAVRIDLFATTGPVSLGDSATYVTILNDDRSPLIGVDDVTVSEGGPGRTVDAVFTVRLFEPSPQPVSVDWDTVDQTAVAPGDYQDDGGTLDFAPGETTKQVAITVNGDNLVEGDEAFYLDLSRSRGGTIASTGSRGVALVLDNDAYAVLGNVTKVSGSGIAGTTVTLAGNSRPTRTTTTVTGGAYRFDDVPDGRYTLTPGSGTQVYAPASYTVDVRGGSVTGLSFILLTKPAISGQVVDSSGQGVPGVTVTRTGNSQPAATATTNGQGWYAFSANPAGSYVVKPAATGATFTPTQRTVTQTASNTVTAGFARN